MQAPPLSDGDRAKLKEEYESIVATWPTLGLGATPPPTLQQWIGARAIVVCRPNSSDQHLSDIRLFNAIEKLVTNFRLYNFNLTHIDTDGRQFIDSSQSMAEMLVSNFKLPHHFTKRFSELFDYYQKSLTEVVNSENVGLTPLANANLIDALQRFIGRTAEAVVEREVDVDRAIGRVEGAAALLLRANVISRERAAEETDQFKKVARKKK